MERLFEIHAEGEYDLIVVDTPPTRNALDFLEAPERMAEFFSPRLPRWLTVPYRSRLVDFASRPSTRSPTDPRLATAAGRGGVLHPLPAMQRGFVVGPAPYRG